MWHYLFAWFTGFVMGGMTWFEIYCWVKNKSNELIAKCSLEDYLKRKHGDSFRQLIITRCVPDYFGGANIFNDLFYGRQF